MSYGLMESPAYRLWKVHRCPATGIYCLATAQAWEPKVYVLLEVLGVSSGGKVPPEPEIHVSPSCLCCPHVLGQVPGEVIGSVQWEGGLPLQRLDTVPAEASKVGVGGAHCSGTVLLGRSITMLLAVTSKKSWDGKGNGAKSCPQLWCLLFVQVVCLVQGQSRAKVGTY